MDWLTKELFILYGPLAIGWIIAIGLWVDARLERKGHRKELNQITEAYHSSNLANVRVLDAVATKTEDHARSQEKLSDAVHDLAREIARGGRA